MEFVVPYESGARRITSNLGSDLFCPLWLVGLAHLEWRARVARSCCIGRRWSVGCSPLARYLLSSCGVWWEVFSSLAETPPVVNMEVETCSHCPARLSLSYLGWTTCLPGRLFTDLGKGKAAGGNACPGQRCSPLRSLSHGGFRSRLRSSSCGVEGGACILGPKATEMKYESNLP